MELYVPQEIAAAIIEIAHSFRIDAKIIGHCESSESGKLTIKSPYGTFEY